jgi:hypothetical protein
MKIHGHKTVLNMMLILLAAAFAAGHASRVTPVSTTATPMMASPTATHPNINSAHIRVPGLWSGQELDRFMTVNAVWKVSVK